MKWFRTRARYGAKLALVALAIQFVLSFGHFHWDGAQAAPAIHPGAAQSVTAPADRAIAGNAVAESSQPASRRGADQDHDRYCAICVAVSLASTVMCAEPPLLRLPEAYHFLYLTTDAEFSHLAARHFVFQPRAPPAS